MSNRASYTLRPRCYRSDKNGAIGEDISTLILDGLVKVDADAETPMTFTARTDGAGAIPAFSYVAPFLTVEWYDPELGVQSITEQVGLYVVMPPGETHTAVQAVGRIEGRDPTWVLKQDTLPTGLNVAAGANVVTTVKGLLTGAGFTRENIPAKSNTFLKKRAYEPGTSRLDAINDMLFRIGYYSLFADRQGILSSRPFRPLSREEPARRISSANGDVVNVVNLDPDPERLANRVTVIKTDAADDPLVVTRTNARPDSPVSTVNLGMVLGKKIEASNLDTTAELDALALKILEEGASMLTRIEVDTIPDPRFEVRDVVHVVISRDDGTLVADGRWWSDEVSCPFTPQAGAMKWRLNKLIEFEGV
jgi:hypothetical protein